jgi:hypothetical protein
MKNKLILIDDSLSLINRTGAHQIAKDLLENFSDLSSVRRWRLMRGCEPEGIVRKIFGRMMLADIRFLSNSRLLRWPEVHGASLRLFLDPLYVLRSRFDKNDVVLCHDVGPIKSPELYGDTTRRLYDDAYKKIRDIGPAIVFVSETTCSEFHGVYGNGFRLSKVISAS